MGIFSNKFMNNLEKMAYAGFRIVYGSNDNSRNVQSIYKGYRSNLDKVQRKLDSFQRSIDVNQLKLNNIDIRIERAEMYIDRINSRGLMTQFSRRYRDEKKYIKYLKKQKRMINKKIREEYKSIKLENKKFKHAKKELREFEKYVNKFAKEHVDEIKFISYFKKNKIKLERIYSSEKISEIMEAIERMKVGEKGFEDISVKKYLNELKEDIKKNSKIFSKSKNKNKKIRKVKSSGKFQQERNNEDQNLKESKRKVINFKQRLKDKNNFAKDESGHKYGKKDEKEKSKDEEEYVSEI